MPENLIGTLENPKTKP